MTDKREWSLHSGDGSQGCVSHRYPLLREHSARRGSDRAEPLPTLERSLAESLDLLWSGLSNRDFRLTVDVEKPERLRTEAGLGLGGPHILAWQVELSAASADAPETGVEGVLALHRTGASISERIGAS